MAITVVAGGTYKNVPFNVDLSKSTSNAFVKIALETGYFDPDGNVLKLGGSDQVYEIGTLSAGVPPGIYLVPDGALTITIHVGLRDLRAYIVAYAMLALAIPSLVDYSPQYGAMTEMKVVEAKVVVEIGQITITALLVDFD